jgi:hypothetical protein
MKLNKNHFKQERDNKILKQEIKVQEIEEKSFKTKNKQ